MQRTRSTGTLLGLAALGLLASTMSLTDSAQAQTTSNGPYYAEPSWSQKLPAAKRFVVLTDWNSEAVLDRETGLVWERSPAVSFETWITARNTCANKTVGGRKGWRLPAIAELASLIDPSVGFPGPALPLGHPFFFAPLSNDYWSATSSVESPTGAWAVDFQRGVVFTGNKTFSDKVWCVRGGMTADQY